MSLKKKSLHDLSKNEVGDLTKEEFLAYFNIQGPSAAKPEMEGHADEIKAALKPFEENDAHIELLQANSDRALSFLHHTNPLYRKIKDKWQYLKKKSRTLQERNKITDNNPNAFSSLYSEKKYANHKPTAEKWKTDLLKVKGGIICNVIDPPIKIKPIAVASNSPKEEAGIVRAVYKRVVKKLTEREKNDIVCMSFIIN